MLRHWISVPTPRFVVLYNGEGKQPEQRIYKLSDAFVKPTDEPELELIVKVYNINEGYNRSIVEACQTLREYVQFVSKIREFMNAVLSLVTDGILTEEDAARRLNMPIEDFRAKREQAHILV